MGSSAFCNSGNRGTPTPSGACVFGYRGHPFLTRMLTQRCVRISAAPQEDESPSISEIYGQSKWLVVNLTLDSASENK